MEPVLTRETRVAANALIIHNDKILLCRFSSHLTDIAGQWSLPGGGIDFGESLEEAVIREVWEETGTTVKVGPVIDVFSKTVKIPRLGVERHALRIVFQCTYESGELRNEIDGSTDQCRWISREEVSDLTLFDITQRNIDKFMFIS